MAEIETGKVGLGLLVSSDTTTISIPYRLNSDWRIEPYLAYVQDSNERKIKESGDLEKSYQSDSDQYKLGVSLARILLTEDKLSLYSGFSLAYVSKNSDRRTTNQNFHESSFSRTVNTYVNKEKAELAGYEAGLNLGLQYQVFENIELAGEIALNYRDLSGDTKGSDTTTNATSYNDDSSRNTSDVNTDWLKSDEDESAFFTSTRLIVRMYF